MKLEDLPRYCSPEPPSLTDASASTSKDALSITDVVTARSMTQNQAEMRFSAFLGKMSISMNNRERTAELLTEYTFNRCDRVAALRKFPAKIKPTMMRIMASYAFEDYARSMVSRKQYSYCHEEKFIESEVLTNKIQYPDGKPPA